MPTQGCVRSDWPSQRDIYDLRYRGDGYDHRSAVSVLTTEREALHAAVRRALATDPDLDAVTVLDFGYGTGRVTNEFVATFPAVFGHHGKDLHVIAYDVSSVGLRKGARSLEGRGFSTAAHLSFEPRPAEGYVAGTLHRAADGLQLTVTFAHARDCTPVTGDGTGQIGRLVRKALGTDACRLTTSWYSGLGHLPGSARRRRFFRALGRVTDPAGELLVAVSSTGDPCGAPGGAPGAGTGSAPGDRAGDRAGDRGSGDVEGFPVEEPGDTVYETELGQRNFWHVFGKDLEDCLRDTRSTGQTCWVEAVRMPDPEFSSRAAEQGNLRRVRAFNAERAHREWTAADYAQVHTVAAVRSGAPGGPPVVGLVR